MLTPETYSCTDFPLYLQKLFGSVVAVGISTPASRPVPSRHTLGPIHKSSSSTHTTPPVTAPWYNNREHMTTGSSYCDFTHQPTSHPRRISSPEKKTHTTTARIRRAGGRTRDCSERTHSSPFSTRARSSRVTAIRGEPLLLLSRTRSRCCTAEYGLLLLLQGKKP